MRLRVYFKCLFWGILLLDVLFLKNLIEIQTREYFKKSVSDKICNGEC
jgi:hypothetical protein